MDHGDAGLGDPLGGRIAPQVEGDEQMKTLVFVPTVSGR